MEASDLVTARRYTRHELLYLRSSLSVITCPIGKINKHVDIASIFRIPDEAFDHSNRFSCHSKTLASITNLHNLLQGTRRHFTESSEESEDRASSSMNSKRDYRQYQWSFRRRESSDRSSQPRSAPTGIAAQQSENFQRFYQAVVSPTHLRVTAGGRVVPNTRSTAPALPPPQFDWNSNKFPFDETISDPEQDLEHSRPEPCFQNTVLPFGYPIAAANAFAPPYALNPQSNPVPGMAFPAQTGIEGDTSVKMVRSANSNGESGSRTLSPSASTHPIKISPPSQFDQSKPFIYNGQIVYPVPHGFPPPPTVMPLGMNMLGNPSFLSQAQLPSSAGYLPAQFPGCLSGMPGPLIFPGQQMSMVLPSFLPTEPMGPMIPFLPIRSMSTQAEAMRTQILHLHNQVKFLDHQLANNKHQIDEHGLGTQRAIFMSQIRNLELTLEFQAAQEASTTSGDHNIIGGSVSQELAVVPSVAYSTKPGNAENAINSSALVSQKKGLESEPMAQPTGLLKTSASSNADSRVETTVKSKLSIKAPAFQPRSQSQALVLALEPPQVNVCDDLNVVAKDEEPETQAQIEDRLLSRATSNWGTTNSSMISIGPVGPIGLPRAHSQHEPVPRNQFNNQPPAPQRSNTFNCTDLSVASNAVPYLVGSLPHGVHASLAKSTDFSYSRALTDEEVRARHLYWGKAPRSVQRGLPKFDGKDFYPPSPVKKNGRMSTAHDSFSSGGDIGDNSCAASASETTFAVPGVKDYKTPSPVRPPYESHNLSSMTQSVAATGLTRYQICPPESSSFTGSAINMASQSAEYRDVGQESCIALTPSAGTNPNETPLDDFSNLFTEPGVPGYKSLTSTVLKPSQNEHLPKKINVDVPITPTNGGFFTANDDEDNDTDPGSLWQPQDVDHQRIKSESDTVISCGSTKTGARSSSSSVEFRLSPQKILSPTSAHEKAFVERVENFRNSDVQTLFLQNMLRNATQSPMVGTALSGAITSATAQGYLPLYRGSAAASLAPTMMNHLVAERDLQYDQTCSETMNGSYQSSISFLPADSLLENRPPHADRRYPQVSMGSDESGAQGYMRLLAEKDDKNKKIIEQALGAQMPPIGPGPRSEW